MREQFLQMLWGPALEASKRIGVDPRIIVAQAALESNWGKSAPGNNLFGIKSHGQAGGNTLATTEVVNGKPIRTNASFRAYGSPAESVSGYADFIASNPRYKPMMQADSLEGQLQALGKSGYATDPNYTDKIRNIIGMLPEGAPLDPAQADFVRNNPQPGGFGPEVEAQMPNMNPGSGNVMSPQFDGGIPEFVADYFNQDENKPNMMQRLGAALSAFDPPPPPPAGFSGGSGPGNQLLKYLNSPTMADILLKKRLC